MDTKRVRISGPGIPVQGDDIDTDRIIPARYLRTVVFEGLGEHAFEDDRAQLRDAGQTHPFDDAKYADARVLVVNKNFGCGSSREHAPQSIMRWGKGIAAIVGESFAEIFYGNCTALGIPCAVVTQESAAALQHLIAEDPTIEICVDVEARVVTAGGLRVAFEMADGTRNAFVEGRWDSTAELLEDLDGVRRTAAALPYLDGFR